MINLHTHSKISDGILEPPEVAEKAKEAKLEDWALCDHDSIAGLIKAAKKSSELNIGFINGIEISCQHKFHILGLGFNANNVTLLKHSNHQRIIHRERAISIIAILEENGFVVNKSILQKEQGNITVFNIYQHTATELSFSEFAKLWIYKGSPHYIKIERLTFKQAIELIHDAEGIAVSAHLGHTFKKELHNLENAIKKLKEAGIDALEVFSTKHNEEQTRILHRLALKYDLAMTVGTDFHGHSKNKIGEVIKSYRLPFDKAKILKLVIR